MAEYIDKVFGPGGYLAGAISGYEKRDGQVAMANAVDRVIDLGGQLVVEAGTGSGKSYAYSAPAIYNICKRKADIKPHQVVIATANITLQQQLVEKDLPALVEALPWKVTYKLLKGRGNFICRSKVDELINIRPAREGKASVNDCTFGLTDDAQINEVHTLISWAEATETGDKADGSLIFEPSWQAWAQVTRERNECLGNGCHLAKNCFYLRHRAEAWKADIIVTNYHVLMAHAQVLEKTESNYVLPPFDTLIGDEAHELEDIARDTFGFTISQSSFNRVISYGDTASGNSRSGVFKETAKKLRKARDTFFKAALDRYDADDAVSRLKPGRHYVYNDTRGSVSLTQAGADELLRITKRDDLDENFQRQVGRVLISTVIDRSPIKRTIKEEPDVLFSKHVLDELMLLQRYITADVDELGVKQTRGKLSDNDRRDLAFARSVLRTASSLIENVDEFSGQKNSDRAYWLEKSDRGKVQLKAAQIDVSKPLSTLLFPIARAVVLTSATLATGGNFSYTSKSLGLSPMAKTMAVASPFNHYDQQIVMVPPSGYVPDDPNDPNFNAATIDVFKQVIDSCQGRTLGLFTSYKALHEVASALRDVSSEYNGYPVLVQGDMPRNDLARIFREDTNSVLLGTRSFWQGLDVPGESLTAVVIHRLPFPAREDPITEAIRDRIGSRAFNDFDLPHMLMAVRQGTGRLIRRKDDVGVIVICDRRAAIKQYGIDLCRSLPKMRHWVQDLSTIPSWLEQARKRVSQ